MTPVRITDFLDHILQAAQEARDFVSGMDRAGFHADRRTQQAAIMSIVIIGEATSRLLERHPEVASAYPDVPWRSIRGMRNRLAHGYFETNLDTVWDTIESALPLLIAQISEIRSAQTSRTGAPADSGAPSTG